MRKYSRAVLESEVWGDNADPDRDGPSNLLEYFTGDDPNVAEKLAPVAPPEPSGSEIVIEYRKSLAATGVVGQIEWSADLHSWHRDRITETTAGEGENHAIIRASWPIGEEDEAFFRLAVWREL